MDIDCISLAEASSSASFHPTRIPFTRTMKEAGITLIQEPAIDLSLQALVRSIDEVVKVAICSLLALLNTLGESARTRTLPESTWLFRSLDRLWIALVPLTQKLPTGRMTNSCLSLLLYTVERCFPLITRSHFDSVIIPQLIDLVSRIVSMLCSPPEPLLSRFSLQKPLSSLLREVGALCQHSPYVGRICSEYLIPAFAVVDHWSIASRELEVSQVRLMIYATLLTF